MLEVLRMLVTGKDNETHDLVRWLCLVGAIQGLALVCYTVIVKGQAFDLQTFGLGFGALLAATGVALGAKAHTEPGSGK
jgi:hypothetical protein